MSNSSSPITPIYGGDEYNRILAAIPLEVEEEEEESSSDDFFFPLRPRRNVALVSIYLIYIILKLFIKIV